MILDYRIYRSIYAVLFVAYFVQFPLIGHPNRSLLTRYLWVYIPAVVLTLFVHYLDWLWS